MINNIISIILKLEYAKIVQKRRLRTSPLTARFIIFLLSLSINMFRSMTLLGLYIRQSLHRFFPMTQRMQEEYAAARRVLHNNHPISGIYYDVDNPDLAYLMHRHLMAFAQPIFLDKVITFNDQQWHQLLIFFTTRSMHNINWAICSTVNWNDDDIKTFFMFALTADNDRNLEIFQAAIASLAENNARIATWYAQRNHLAINDLPQYVSPNEHTIITFLQRQGFFQAARPAQPAERLPRNPVELAQRAEQAADEAQPQRQVPQNQAAQEHQPEQLQQRLFNPADEQADALLAQQIAAADDENAIARLLQEAQAAQYEQVAPVRDAQVAAIDEHFNFINQLYHHYSRGNPDIQAVFQELRQEAVVVQRLEQAYNQIIDTAITSLRQNNRAYNNRETFLSEQLRSEQLQQDLETAVYHTIFQDHFNGFDETHDSPQWLRLRQDIAYLQGSLIDYARITLRERLIPAITQAQETINQERLAAQAQQAQEQAVVRENFERLRRERAVAVPQIYSIDNDWRAFSEQLVARISNNFVEQLKAHQTLSRFRNTIQRLAAERPEFAIQDFIQQILRDDTYVHMSQIFEALEGECSAEFPDSQLWHHPEFHEIKRQFFAKESESYHHIVMRVTELLLQHPTISNIQRAIQRRSRLTV